jgi:hypothetical protein
MSQGSWRDWSDGTTFEGTKPPLTLERVGRELRSVRDDVLTLKEAVEIIEARYFGMSVLFPQDRAWLDDLAASAVEFLAAMDRGFRSKTIEEWSAIVDDEASIRDIVSSLCEPDGRDAAKAADAKHVRAAATRKARLWIMLTQAQTHYRMGEEYAGTSTLTDATELLEKGA